MSILRCRRTKAFEAKVGPMYVAMANLKDYIEKRPASPQKTSMGWEYDWPDEMKQLIADYIVAAEAVIPIWESVKVRVERGFEYKKYMAKKAAA